MMPCFSKFYFWQTKNFLLQFNDQVKKYFTKPCHAVFSRRWPYKEVLDVLARRSLAGLTNAWTAQDHTCYWTDTAGAEGFLNILPVNEILF